MNIWQVLTKYWGYTQFRPLQEEIITSILDGKDTLALLPTGGGKSICFQLPALYSEGLCIVVSPLIALMKDQVENLKKKGIKAAAITSSMRYSEIDTLLDNCIYGNYKFLYVSPERLVNELFLERLKKMKLNLIAVDEAHCISYWGYDFRPSYLHIDDLRKLFPKTPLIALTASATPKVAKDILLKLNFTKPNIIQGSFERKNLSYVVLYENNKIEKLLEIIKKVEGSGIVYVRNRKKTQEIALFLKKMGISSNFYHAGLHSKSRDTVQNDWIRNNFKVIVSTNAFGMGIDKPDVRFVVHLDLPDSLEAYYQEAGRAGRDEKKAYAVLLYGESDRTELEQTIINSFPSIEEIKKSYQALSNYYKLAVGSGEGMSFDFDLAKIANTYNIHPIVLYHSLKFIEKEDYLTIGDAYYQPSKIHFIVNQEDLYRFQIANKSYDNFIKLLLRNYTGTFDEYVVIKEGELSAKTGLSMEQISKILQDLEKYRLLVYIPQSSLPKIFFTKARVDTKNLHITKENYSERKKNAIEKMEWVVHYASSTHKCRSQILLSYFGETESYRCGSCDVCKERNKLELSNLEFEQVSNQIKTILKKNPLTLSELVTNLESRDDKSLKVIQWLIDNDKIQYANEAKLVWKK